jgi:hypothetical protein
MHPKQPKLSQLQLLLLQLHQLHTRLSTRKPKPLKAKQPSLLRKSSQKLKLKPQQLSNVELDDNDDLIIDDEVTFGRNRQAEKFGKLVHEKDTELSPYVKIRLALARMKAMEAYKKAQA